MERLEKVVVLDTEVQAERVRGVLIDRGIPHLMRSYHDSAYDGIFQGMKGWGHVEAPPGFHEEIRTIVEDIQRQAETNPPGNQGEPGEDSK